MKPISVIMTFHEMKRSECRRLFSWVSLKLKTYGCVFNASSGKRWYYKTLSVANSSTCLVYILTFRRLQKMFSAQQQQQDLNILNDKSFNGLYCAKLKKEKHQTGRRYVAARVFWFHWRSGKVLWDQTVCPVAPAKRHRLKLRKERKVMSVGEAKNPRFFHRVASLFLRRSN